MYGIEKIYWSSLIDLLMLSCWPCLDQSIGWLWSWTGMHYTGNSSVNTSLLRNVKCLNWLKYIWNWTTSKNIQTIIFKETYSNGGVRTTSNVWRHRKCVRRLTTGSVLSAGRIWIPNVRGKLLLLLLVNWSGLFSYPSYRP